MGTWEHIKLGELPWHNPYHYSAGGDRSKYTETKRESFPISEELLPNNRVGTVC